MDGILTPGKHFASEVLNHSKSEYLSRHRGTNRPPKGDRSAGFSLFLSIFIDFSRKSPIFLKNNIKIYDFWSKMGREWSRIFLKSFLDLFKL